MADQLSAEDQQWLASPVNVLVEPDEQGWLDGMMEMTREQMISYARFQYNIPEAAAEHSGRQELIQLILMANKAGGGAAVLRQSYRYLKGLEDKVHPVTNRGNRPLYLTRGDGDGLQVYNLQANDWQNYKYLIGEAESPEAAAGRPALDTLNNNPAPVQTVVQVQGIPLDSIAGLLKKASRKELEGIAANLGIPAVTDQEQYPTNASLVEAIEAKHNENASASVQQ